MSVWVEVKDGLLVFEEGWGWNFFFMFRLCMIFLVDNSLGELDSIKYLCMFFLVVFVVKDFF